MLLEIERIVTDAGTQTRAGINQDAVDSYAEAYENGDKLPDIDVFYDGETYYLSNGFHRRLAAIKNGKSKIGANVRNGGRREAFAYGLGCNSDNGLYRSNADKRHAIQMAFQRLPDWSDRRIAVEAKVSNSYVSKVRNASIPTDPQVFLENTLDGGLGSLGRDGKIHPRISGNPSGRPKKLRNSASVAVLDRADDRGQEDEITFLGGWNESIGQPASNGSPTYVSKDVRATLTAVGVLTRSLDKIGLGDEYDNVLSEMTRRLTGLIAKH